MSNRHLKLVGSQPKTNTRREKDSERYSVMRRYAIICKEEHASELEEMKDFIMSYSDFPTSAETVVNAICSSFPGHVMCRAQDRFAITSKVTNIFKTRTDVMLSDKSKGGGTYVLRPQVRVKTPRPQAKEAAASPVGQYATKTDISRIESKVESLSATVDKLVRKIAED